MLISDLFRYLVFGSDELYVPKSWLANTDRLQQYVGYTQRQLQQGSVVSDVAAMRRKQFWQRIEAKKVRPDNVVDFERQSQR